MDGELVAFGMNEDWILSEDLQKTDLLCRLSDPRVGFYFGQKLKIAIQRGNGAKLASCLRYLLLYGIFLPMSIAYLPFFVFTAKMSDDWVIPTLSTSTLYILNTSMCFMIGRSNQSFQCRCFLDLALTLSISKKKKNMLVYQNEVSESYVNAHKCTVLFSNSTTFTKLNWYRQIFVKNIENIKVPV